MTSQFGTLGSHAGTRDTRKRHAAPRRGGLMLAAACALWITACGGGGGGEAAPIVSMAPAAAQGLTASTVGTSTPVNAATVPVNGATVPVNGASVPVNAATVPVNGATVPVNGASVSVRTAETSSSLSFAFDLPSARTTSAAVYDGQGRLLRTLWRGEPLAAGRHERSWDLRLDDVGTSSGAEVTVRVVHHDVGYVWQGVVGNSSAQPGQLPFRSFLPPASLSADGRQLHIGLGYNEAKSAVTGLNVDDPQRPAPAVQHVDPFIGVGLVASDGQTLYLAQTGGLSKRSFVFARQVADGRPVTFGNGQSLCLNLRAGSGDCYADQSYPSVIALRAEGEAMATGLAVQREGEALAVAYGGEQFVRVFDKRSGRLLSQWSVPLSNEGSNHLAMGADGDLWVVTGDGVQRYTGIAWQPRLVAEWHGMEKPLALATDPQNSGRIWVAEGGSRQQVRLYGAEGAVVRTVGQRGALQAGAAVAADRLCFTGYAQREHTALAVDGTGQLWVADVCNNRLQRFAGDGSVTASVAWLPASYVSAVDPNRPQRVFSNFLEFEVDYSRVLGSAGSWRLVRNWLPSLPAALRDEHAANMHWGGFRVVTTLAGGRTYAQMHSRGQSVIVELAADGMVREVTRPAAAVAERSGEVLQGDGGLHQAVLEGAQQVVYRRPLDGVAADGQVRWAGRATVLASMPATASSAHHRPGTFAGVSGPRWPVTESGLVVSLDPSVQGNEGFHLGAAPAGGNAWAWQASPSAALDGRGSFQTRGSGDTRIHYGGNVAMTAGRAVVYGFHGEFYSDLGNGRAGQANQFMHFLDNGLFIGQFGVASTRSSSDAAPGLSGNAFSPWLVRVGARLYLYHNDESTWGGVHRWELRGADDIVELRATGVPGSALTLR